MSLFPTETLVVCPRCRGMGTIYDAKVDADKPCPQCGGRQPDEEPPRAA